MFRTAPSLEETDKSELNWGKAGAAISFTIQIAMITVQNQPSRLRFAELAVAVML